jgi:hypothetical protein
VKRVVPLVLVLLLFAALGVLWIATDRRAPERMYEDYSSARIAPKGLSLAFGYLARTRKTSMLTRSVSRAQLETDAVIFRVADTLPSFFDLEELDERQIGPPKPKQRPLLSEAEEAFVRRGGRMIIAASDGLLETAPAESKTIQKVFPIWPEVTRVQQACDCAPAAFTQLRPRMVALFTAGARPVLARERIGKGELFVLSAPDILTNASLSRQNHLALLTALAGDRRPVYFDEVPHGIVSDDGALALMKEWNLGPFLVLLLAVTLLVFWRGGTRIGIPDEEFRDTRSDAIDLVRSLGALYRRVTADSESIALYHDALTRTAAHQTGLRGDALRKRVDELTGGIAVPSTTGRAKMPAHVFERSLVAINKGFEALRLKKGREVQ